MDPAPDPASSTRPKSVYLFGTCLVDLFFPEAGLSAIRLLEREGLRVIFPQGQTCCGQPAFNSGYQAEAREVARAQIELFSEPHPIVAPSGSCAAMMRRHYPTLFEGDPFEARARAFAARVYELTQFLDEVLRIRLADRGEKTRVTWHASCHALREMGIAEEPKRLLGQLHNVEIVTLPRETECCGFGGTFSVRQPEISGAMVDDKAADVAATGAPVLLSADGGCLLNIAGRLEARGDRVAARHIAEFLWERTRER
ncbi:MAG TPA: (Fe-S)-binding protein [Thermoanaerobaculia bacterium]|nr:(Fe-S)-binding protein [Thermoanaerobaculia bacterium]